MSLDTVVEDIREEARARAEEIREDGNQQADEIVREAESEADRILEEREREIERTIEQEREQTVSSAKLEAKQARLEARRDVLEDVRDRMETAVADIDGDRREELTRALLDDAAAEFGEDELVSVYGRADDEDLLTELLAESTYENFEFAGEYDCLGGVVLEGDASRVRVNNTFDSVIESVWEDNLKNVSARLFDEGS
jgi:V/A-type H+-transporting ATPase subunit E